MGRLNPTDFPANVQDVVNETKPKLLNIISILRESIHDLNEIIKVDVDKDALPESVWGLTSKTKQELLEIIARKDDVEKNNQITMMQQRSEISTLKSDIYDMQTNLNKATKVINNYETISAIFLLTVAIIVIIYMFIG